MTSTARSTSRLRFPGRGDDVEEKTERARRKWDKHAAGYDREMAFFERALFAGGREWACAQVAGDVLEIAVGTGRNLAFYPEGIRLTGIDFSSKMLEIGVGRAAELGREVDLRLGDAQAMEFPTDRFDSVVSTFSLCSIPDGRAAVAEVRRVLRPGGRFIVLEHVRSPILAVRIGQWILEPISRLQGDTLLREPLDALRAVGFDLELVEREKWGIVERAVAKKPEVG
jgi:ubiquinone/menaquinone biosynthesis C-methylase UbiE